MTVPEGRAAVKPTPIDAVQHASRLASGDVDAPTLAWVCDGVAVWIRACGALSLERCLRLPSTGRQMRKMRRDYWLAEAAKAVSARSTWLASVALETELRVFVSRGPWLVWREQANPPPDASQLRAALFHVAKEGDGHCLSARQIDRVLTRRHGAMSVDSP